MIVSIDVKGWKGGSSSDKVIPIWIPMMARGACLMANVYLSLPPAPAPAPALVMAEAIAVADAGDV